MGLRCPNGRVKGLEKDRTVLFQYSLPVLITTHHFRTTGYILSVVEHVTCEDKSQEKDSKHQRPRAGETVGENRVVRWMARRNNTLTEALQYRTWYIMEATLE